MMFDLFWTKVEFFLQISFTGLLDSSWRWNANPSLASVWWESAERCSSTTSQRKTEGHHGLAKWSWIRGWQGEKTLAQWQRFCGCSVRYSRRTRTRWKILPASPSTHGGVQQHEFAGQISIVSHTTESGHPRHGASVSYFRHGVSVQSEVILWRMRIQQRLLS